MAYQELPRLSEEFDCSLFRSGADELDQWLIHSALENSNAGNARVFVATSGTRVAGYYALASAAVANDAAVTPGAVRRQAPDPIPCLLVARLAVDRDFQGQRLGTRLFQDILWRSARLSDDLGFRALLIHARDDAARDFYLRLTASFRPSPSDPHHLFLPIKNLRSLVR